MTASRSAIAAGLALLVLLSCGGSAFTAGAAADAGAVEAAAPDAGPGYCAQHPEFELCSDFDQAQLPEKWDGVNKSGSPTAGDVVEDGTTSTSAPNSLLATTPALPATDGGTAATASALVTKKGLGKGAVHIAFDIELEQLNLPNKTDATSSETPVIYTQGKDYAVALAFLPSQTAPFTFALVELANTVTGGKTVIPHVLKGAPQLSAWSHVRIDVNIDQGSNAAIVTVDQLSPEAVTLSPPLGTVTGDRTLSVGATSTAPIGAVKIRFDNVTYSSK